MDFDLIYQASRELKENGGGDKPHELIASTKVYEARTVIGEIYGMPIVVDPEAPEGAWFIATEREK